MGGPREDPRLGLVCALHRISSAIALRLMELIPPIGWLSFRVSFHGTVDALCVDMMHFIWSYMGLLILGLHFERYYIAFLVPIYRCS